MTFAPLPATVQGMAGPITIARPHKIENGSWGMWVAANRTILVIRSLSRRVAWQVLYHEMMHAALWDGGVSLPDSDTEERVCDVTSAAMMAGLGAPQSPATAPRPARTARRPRQRARPR